MLDDIAEARGLTARLLRMAVVLGVMWVTPAQARDATDGADAAGTAAPVVRHFLTGKIDGRDTIVLNGQINTGDDQEFIRLASGLDHALIFLNGPGGNMITALNIGRYVRTRGWDTAVADKQLCMSACAELWLAGTTRYMTDTALIGFHAAYQVEQDKAVESSIGNALVGAYLNSLGLSDKAVIYITYSPPEDIQILTKADAIAVGIDVAPLPRGLATLGTALADMPSAATDMASMPPRLVVLTRRVAKVRDLWTTVHRDPDRAAPAMARLRPGSSVTVLRLLWSMKLKWAEVEVGSDVGYVLNRDIDPS
jgi:hypothetical protein